ncbi:MAG: transposase [Euryarchaeota archaeon]|nr:transposase [Euryarchaeota archaeon]
MGVTISKFDWKKYGKSKERELHLLLREAKRIVWETDEPWSRERFGRPPYLSRTMVLICILRIYFKMTYRDVEGLLRANETLRKELELSEVPDHNTIQRATEKMPADYLRRINDKITIKFKKRGMTLPSMRQDSV